MVEEIDGMLDPGKVVMRVRHQPNPHDDLDSGAISHLNPRVKPAPKARFTVHGSWFMAKT
jgi:hypothetical protein